MSEMPLDRPRRCLLGRLLVMTAVALSPPSVLAEAAGGPPTVEIDAQSLLAASDEIRNPPGSFSLRNTLTEFRNGRQSAQSVLGIFARPAHAGGQYDNLVRFEAPARDAGKLMLRNGLDLWFYDPATRASVRISPQQRLLGQASNGDVMTTRLARDYRAAVVAREEIDDGDGVRRATIRLGLVAQHVDLAYARVDYWVDERSRNPVMARYRSDSGRLMKTAYFRRYRPVLGAERPTETVIIDGLDPTWVTLMQVSDHALRDIPAAWMQRDYLPRFTGR